MKHLTGLCTRRPIGTIMVCLGLCAVALLAAAGLGVELLPDVRMPRLVVSTTFEGLPATEVRTLITIPLEDALSSLRGVRRISSVSREGVSILTLEFHWGTDMQIAAVQTRELIDVAHTSLPSDCRKPLVLPVDPGEEAVLTLGVFALDGDLSLTRRIAEREVKTRLQQVRGVGTITVVGGTCEEVKVHVDQALLAGRGLALDDLNRALGDSNFDYPVGTLREGRIEYLVQAKGSVTNVDELGDLYLGEGDGSRTRIREVAQISLGAARQRSTFQVDGQDGVGLLIRRRPGTSPLELSRTIRAEVGRLEQSYGRDLRFQVVRDESAFIARSLRDLALSTAGGCLIAFVVVLFFVRSLPITAILITSVPVSILTALLGLSLVGRTINVMSLGGLALGIGMMMDNSVAVLENLERRLIRGGEGISPQGVARAVAEVSTSNVGSTLTSVVVFLPVIFLPGVVGAVFTDLSLSVIFSQIASFLVSVTLVPVLFLLAGRRMCGVTRRVRPVEALERGFRAATRVFLRRPLILALALLVITAAGYLSLRDLPFEFMPTIDTGEVDVNVTLPHGAAIHAVSDTGRQIAGRILLVKGVRGVYARAGGEEDDAFYLADPTDRPEILHAKVLLETTRRASSFDIAAELSRLLVVEQGTVDVNLPRGVVEPLLGVGGDEIEVEVGGDDPGQAVERALDLARTLASRFPGLSVMPTGERPEIHFRPTRDMMARAGVDLLAIATAVRNALEGAVPTTLRIQGRETDVRVLLRPLDVRAGRLGDLSVRSPQGAPLRLGELGEMEEVTSSPALLRSDRTDVAYLRLPTSGARGRVISAQVAALTQGQRYLHSREQSVFAENAATLALTLGLVVLLLYLVLGVQFESFVLPLLLLGSLPLSFAGIFGALWLTGKSLNFDSILGIIVLFGIAVNNSMVLYESITQRSAPGRELLAVYRGAPIRLRPILITMLSTVVALVPVALDPMRTSTQSSMAVAIIGGLFVSTTLTLFVIPQLFLVYLRRHRGSA